MEELFISSDSIDSELLAILELFKWGDLLAVLEGQIAHRGPTLALKYSIECFGGWMQVREERFLIEFFSVSARIGKLLHYFIVAID